MKLPFHAAAAAPSELRKPTPSPLPQLDGAELAAMYHAARVGGDFYDFVMLPTGELVMVLLDIAGKREQALHIAAGTQEVFRQRTPELFDDGGNESESLTALLIEINRSVMHIANGICCTPTFLCCYNPALGITHYLNAGHTPALVKEGNAVSKLEATGIPLGLFSHTTQDAQICVMSPGTSMLLVSKGIPETRGGTREYGIERVAELLATNSFRDAQELCARVLNAVTDFMGRSESKFAIPGLDRRTPNDMTALALIRANNKGT